MLLADLYVRSRHHSTWWDVAGVVSLCLLIFWPLISGNLYSFFQFFLLPILGAGIIGGALFGVRIRRALSVRWVCSIGGMAYSIYLTHFPLMYLLSRSGFWRGGSYNLHIVLLGLYLVPIVFAFGLLFYVLVEKPCMDPDWPQHLRIRLRDINLRSYGGQRVRRPPKTDIPAPAPGAAG
jgi:peptidoglycan/LPS O-acetylase OafA/YrhL